MTDGAPMGETPAPRLLIVTATDRRRGAEVFTRRLGDGLATRGWMVQTVSLTTSGDSRSVDVEALTDVSSARPGRFNRRISSALSQRIREFEPDLILANGGSTLRYGALATLLSHVPMVYIAIGEPDYWIRSALSRAANRWMLARARRVLAVCEATAQQLVALDPSLAGRVFVTYTGVPDEMFGHRPRNGNGQLRVVMVGSLSEEKDPSLALRTIARVPSTLFRVVGAGPLAERLREEARQLGVEDRVELVGAVDDVVPHLQWADILLLTSRTEGLPGAILEAGAASVATVALDVGGVREAVGDGVTGIVVAPGDEDGLVHALD
ncbi:MAG TPA: glycosyltransferase, partial [Acidimicrobiia bacterium]|nr:glycosyltransferase [Acidimicrobiia bacterium]